MLIYNRAVNILCRYLTDKELIELADELDGDPTNGFVEILTEAVEERGILNYSLWTGLRMKTDKRGFLDG